MATRPVFFATHSGPSLVSVRLVDFTWFAGMAPSRKQLSIDSLHAAIRDGGESEILEISSKSKLELGVSLSAFNLGFVHRANPNVISVESAFQGSKVFDGGGPFHELYTQDARIAKKFFHEKKLGAITGFNFFGQKWPAKPRTLFYNWIYLQSVKKTYGLSEKVSVFNAFTDIEFNPERSLNSQAYSAALYVSLFRRGEIDAILGDRPAFMKRLETQGEWFTGTPYEKNHPGEFELL